MNAFVKILVMFIMSKAKTHEKKEWLADKLTDLILVLAGLTLTAVFMIFQLSHAMAEWMFFSLLFFLGLCLIFEYKAYFEVMEYEE